MLNIFNALKRYAEKWNVKESRLFNEEEVASVEKAEVVESQYGNSVCFTMKNGGMTFIPASPSFSLGVGDIVDVSKVHLVTLQKSGEDDILRIED